MQLSKILDSLGSLEKNSFIKIIDSIISKKPKNYKAIDKILSTSDKGLKSVDSQNIAKIFELVEEEFSVILKNEFVEVSSQLDIHTDIITRDGNCLMKQDWFSRLYETELKTLKRKIKELKSTMNVERSDWSIRLRDYNIYLACVKTSYSNDILNNREPVISSDELSILITLSEQLNLSQEETKLLNYMVVPAERLDIDQVITNLKNIGLIFYSKKQNTVYIADEMVRLVRRLRGKKMADKYLRRILKVLRGPEINLIAKSHNIDRKLSQEEKISEIIREGVSIISILTTDVHKEETNLTEKKKFVNELWSNGLALSPSLKGVTLEDKIENLLQYFEAKEKDEKIGISIDGYKKLLSELNESLPKLNKEIKSTFELQSNFVLDSDLLLNFNLKPRDILDLLSKNDITTFCKNRGISTRGNDILNILDFYKDSENLYLENYENIGYRNLNELRENGINIKESELGLKFEELTKKIFIGLGFNVDEKLKNQLNSRKDKVDILLNIGDNQVIIVECKTSKESGYNKFSSVSRQLKAYSELINKQDYIVIKSLLIAPEFSDDFISDCELEYDLNLSLLTASSLITILDGFKVSKHHKYFPYKLLMRDVVINENRILKAMQK